MNFLWIPIGSFLVSVIGAWFLGRALPTSTDDPSLAEKIQTHRGRLFLLVFVVVLLSVIAWFPWEKSNWDYHLAATVIPYLILMLIWNGTGVMIGDFPKRKILFEERWRLTQFLASMPRIYFGLSGFWLVLILAPFGIHFSGSLKWLVAGFLFVALLAWSRLFHRVTAFFLGARPLRDAELIARFSEIQAQSHAPPTRVLVMGPELGSFSNAFALPSVNRPSVVFSKPLLSVLEPIEAAAIFAHEIAHIEDFDRKKLRKLRLGDAFLVLTACWPIVLIVQFASSFTTVFLLAWLPIVLAFLIYRTKSSQKAETNSDLRAVALAGDGEALIRGLIKLHTANRMPRRLAAEVERSGTHPSLAQRIRDIRQAMRTLGQTSESAPDAASEPGLGGSEEINLFLSREKVGDFLVVYRQRIHWLSLNEDDLADISLENPDEDCFRRLQDQAVRAKTMALRELVELRLVVKRNKPALRMVDRKGKPSLFPLKEDDIALVQVVLDQVEQELSPSKITSIQEVTPVRLWAFAAGILSFLASIQGLVQFGEAVYLLVGTIVVLLIPRRPAAFAVGAMAVLIGVTTVLTSTDRSWWSSAGWSFLIGMILSGLAVLWQTRRRKTEQPEKRLLETGRPVYTALFWLLVGAPFLLVYLTVLNGGDYLAKLYALGLYGKVVFAPLLAAGGALIAGRPASKMTGLFVLILGLSPVFLGSPFFLRNILRDPLMASVPFLTLTDAPLELLAQKRIDAIQPWGFRLSPSGSRFLAPKVQTDDYSDLNKTFLISDFDGEQQQIDAIGLDFIDEDQVLALEVIEDHLAIRAYAIADPRTATWTLSFNELEPGGGFTLSVHQNHWRLTMGLSDNVSLWFSGEIGSDQVSRRSYYRQIDADHERYMGKGDRCLEIVWGRENRKNLPALSVFHDFYQPTKLSLRENETEQTLATTMLWIDAQAPSRGEGDIMFIASAPKQNWIWTVNPDSGVFKPHARMDANLAWRWDGALLGVLREDAFLLVDPINAMAVQTPLPKKLTWSVSLAMRESVVGLCHSDEGETHVLVFQKPRLPFR